MVGETAGEHLAQHKSTGHGCQFNIQFWSTLRLSCQLLWIEREIGKTCHHHVNGFRFKVSAIRFVTKSPYTTHHLYALVGWPSLHIRCQTHWLQVIYKSMLGKPQPYLSSLVTITTPTHSTRSSRYISLIIPKANTLFGPLSFQFSAACDVPAGISHWSSPKPTPHLAALTGTNCKIRWSWRLLFPSSTLNINYLCS
jgi:hypothetical protein